MSQIEKTLVCPGLSMPFYPMRPRKGLELNLLNYLKLDYEKYVWLLKLNGDRAGLVVRDGKVKVQNRHGRWYSFTVKNSSKFESLKGTWLMDGEVKDSCFYPFEVLVAAGTDLRFECPEIRVNRARQLCSELKIEWKYGCGTSAMFTSELLSAMKKKDGTVYEGVVGRLKGSRYLQLGFENQDSVTWVKRKWSL